MASPFVPVPVPMDRASSRRPQRASSLGSVSSSSESSSPVVGGDRGGGGGAGPRRASRCSDRGGGRSRTPPPVHGTGTRTNGASEFSGCTRSTSDPTRQDRPVTPTVLGYEVMEERAKFTVYKVLVRKCPDESWVVFRRYTDFSRLNDKLKEMFPGFRLSLPPKRWFKDNYDSDFLEDRQLGLQVFLQNLVAHKDIANCLAVREFLCLDEPPGPFDSLEESRSLAVREFLCLDEPPGPFDSLEESRAFCETLEESNYRLQKEVMEKQKEIISLRRKLEEREKTLLLLEKHINGECVIPLSAQDSEISADADVESSAAEADQEIDEDGSRCELQPVRSSACWCGPTLAASPPVIQVTQLIQQRPEP